MIYWWRLMLLVYDLLMKPMIVCDLTMMMYTIKTVMLLVYERWGFMHEFEPWHYEYEFDFFFCILTIAGLLKFVTNDRNKSVTTTAALHLSHRQLHGSRTTWASGMNFGMNHISTPGQEEKYGDESLSTNKRARCPYEPDYK